MVQAASTSETSVNFSQTTRHNNPEDSHIQLINLYLVRLKTWELFIHLVGPVPTHWQLL
jgi:hypothetical protein